MAMSLLSTSWGRSLVCDRDVENASTSQLDQAYNAFSFHQIQPSSNKVADCRAMQGRRD